MIKKKKKHNQLSDKGNALLDTSFQFERIKSDEFEANLNKLAGSNRVFASFYSLYEFKTGIILSLIDYYFKVGACKDISKALIKWSDRWGRDVKYQLLLQAILYRLNDSIPTKDIEKYLRQIETAIAYFLVVFENKLSGLIGSFAGDEIVKLEITTRESYQTFWDAYHSRDILPMSNFWQSNYGALITLIGLDNLKTKYPKMYDKLEKIHKNPQDSEKLKTVNRGVGDAIIAIDCPKKYLLATTDASFDYLCPPLKKTHIKYSKI